MIDDGSPEPVTPAFAPRFPGVRFIRQANQGIAVTRDNGAHLATGELLAYLDDDDLWPPDSLRRRVEALLAHPELNVVGGETRLFRPGRPPGPSYYADHFPRLAEAEHTDDGELWIYPREALLDMMLLSLPFYAQTVLARRDWFLSIGGWGRGASIYAECYDFWYRATVDGAIGFLTLPVADIRRGHAQATADIPGGRLMESADLVRWSREVGDDDWRRIAPRLARRFVSRTVFNVRRACPGAAARQAWCAVRVGFLDPIVARRLVPFRR